MDTYTREWDLMGVYCKAWPEGFLSTADVCLLVEGKQLPAHSQFLASKSAVIRKMLEDCPAYSKQQPLALTKAFARYKTADIQTFLKHVYKNANTLTPTEAVQLLTISDHLDCPDISNNAVRYLESHSDKFLKATCEDTGALFWLQIAHQFSLDDFTERCMHFVSDHHQALQEDPRMQLLSPKVFLQLMQRQQTVLQAQSLVYIRHKEKLVCYWCCNACTGHALPLGPTAFGASYLGLEEGATPWCGAKKVVKDCMHAVALGVTCQELIMALKKKMPECC